MTLRTLVTVILAAVSLSAVRLHAQESGAPPLNPNLRAVEFGVRIHGVDGDQARSMRFEDLRTGVVLDRARYTRAKETNLFTAEADQVGYRDQRFAVGFQQFGRVRAWFEWNQIPFFLSETARTMFREEALGVLRVDDAVQQAIQGATNTLAASVAANALAFDLRSRRDIADAGMRYQANSNLDVNVRLVSQARSGAQPWGAGFGMGTPIELSAPIEDRTTDIGTSVEWSTRRGLLRVGYDGSFYNNDADVLVWDNPIRLVDTAAASSQGRMPLWPSSTAHTLSATGSIALPARGRATASVSSGHWFQDEQLLPFTINTALATPSLERTSVEGEAAVTSALLRYTARPNRWVWVNASYRLYDFDNKTPHLAVPQQIKYDQAVQTATLPETEPLSFTRALFEADASFTPFRHGALRTGYAREDVDRSFRLFETTTDHVLRLSYDVTSLDWITLRAAYQRAHRTGEGLDEEVLSDIGEQVSLRQFDIANRTRNQASVIVTVLPSALWSANLSIGRGTEDRPEAQFGLTDTSFGTYAVGFDVAPSDGLAFAASYGFETYDGLQRSRQANPGAQFNDPTRDWSTDQSEHVHTLNLNLNVLHALPDTELRVGYDFTRSRANYTYSLVSDSTLVTPQPLPDIRNEWQRATVDARYRLRRNLAVGLTYWYDRFTVDDFAFSPSTMDRLVFGSTTLLGLIYRPYTANTVWLRLTYLW